MKGSGTVTDAPSLPGCDAPEVSQARDAAAQLLDRFHCGRTYQALEPTAGLFPAAEAADCDG